MKTNSLSVSLINNVDVGTGAARAVCRLATSLDRYLDAQISVNLFVSQSKSDLTMVVVPNSTIQRAWAMARVVFGASLQSLQVSDNPVRHSSSWLPCRFDRKLNLYPTDVLHLHWVQEDMLSIEAIGRLRKPVVWTLHDSWAFCGSEHYPRNLTDVRYEQGYFRNNRHLGDSGLDLDRWCWGRKISSWRKPIQLVAPSRWMADCVRRSALMRNWPVTVIPNALPTQVYRPWPKNLARQMFGLPVNAPLLLFGAVGGLRDSRKGWDLLQHALRQLVSNNLGIHAVVCGQHAPVDPPRLGLPIHYMGKLNDDQALAMLYSAVDVVVVSSRLDNLPQMATEAQSCGIPVVAFDVGGLPDVVQHMQTGYLATPFDIHDLARGIQWILEDSVRHSRLSAQARSRAVENWSEHIIAKQHLSLYQDLLHT